LTTQASDSGLLAITAEAVDRRLARDTPGVHAHYQLETSQRAGRAVYWVETLGEDKGQIVEVDPTGDFYLASCGCVWFLDYFRKDTCCKHIAKSVEHVRSKK
jgi:hypothetical protein